MLQFYPTAFMCKKGLVLILYQHWRQITLPMACLPFILLFPHRTSLLTSFVVFQDLSDHRQNSKMMANEVKPQDLKNYPKLNKV